MSFAMRQARVLKLLFQLGNLSAKQNLRFKAHLQNLGGI